MTCPGPGRADECDRRACRYGGCQGRTPGTACPVPRINSDEAIGRELYEVVLESLGRGNRWPADLDLGLQFDHLPHDVRRAWTALGGHVRHAYG